jgi:hypothetical protein
MFNFDVRASRDLKLTGHVDDFITCEDELPAAVIITEDGAFARGTLVTEVQHETTDDN